MAGEAACTGVHGANRLASNSLLEGLVFGARIGRALIESRGTLPEAAPIPTELLSAALSAPCQVGSRRIPGEAPSPEEIIRQVGSVSWEKLGIVRDAQGISSAIDALDTMMDSEALSTESFARCTLEARNMVTVARLVAGSALVREESRGSHYRDDHRKRDDRRYGSSSYIARGMSRAVIAARQASTTL